MIKTIQRPPEQILLEIPEGKSIGIMGCGECAAALGHGGTKAVESWVKRFEHRNPVAFAVVVDSPCDQRFLEKSLALFDEPGKVDLLLVLACPAGVQSLIDLLQRRKCSPRVIAGLKAEGMGWLKTGSTLTKACRFCRECTYDPAMGSCPVPTCPLQKSDGPCQNRGPDDVCPLAKFTCIWIKNP